MPSRSRLSTSLVALVLALGVSAVLLLVSGHDPVVAFGALVSGAMGSHTRLGETLVNTVPLILTGLAVAVGFRAGLFNIGVEGQLLMGAVAVAAVAPALGGLGVLSIPLLFAIGAGAGALWAFVPGYLKARLGANEVITSLMMSYIAFYVVEYLIVGPLKAPGVLPATSLIPDATRLPRIGFLASEMAGVAGLPQVQPDLFGRLHVGVIVALLVAPILSWLIWRSVPGFAMRALGMSVEAATYGGVRVRRAIVLTMLLSGGVAGIAGVIQVLGVNYRMSSSFSPGFGFTGIAVALLGNLSSVGVVLAASLFGALQTGGQVMQRTAGIPSSIVTIIQGLVIFFVAVQLEVPRSNLLLWAGTLRSRLVRWRS